MTAISNTNMPHIALLYLENGNIADTIETIEWLHQHYPTIRSLVLLPEFDGEIITQLRAGYASGWIEITAEPGEIKIAVNKAMDNKKYFPKSSRLPVNPMVIFGKNQFLPEWLNNFFSR